MCTIGKLSGACLVYQSLALLTPPDALPDSRELPRLAQQAASPPMLRPPALVMCHEATGRHRTPALPITKRPLYRLSYGGALDQAPGACAERTAPKRSGLGPGLPERALTILQRRGVGFHSDANGPSRVSAYPGSSRRSPRNLSYPRRVRSYRAPRTARRPEGRSLPTSVAGALSNTGSLARAGAHPTARAGAGTAARSGSPARSPRQAPAGSPTRPRSRCPPR